MQTALELNQPIAVELHKSHSHNCSHCHEHEDHEKKTGTRSLAKEICAKDKHQCNDPLCKIEAPHGHNDLKQNHKHKHRHDCGHHHDHHNHGKFPLLPLENSIAHSKLPQEFKEFLLNTSFLSPALIASTILKNVPLPKLFKTWLSLSAMHGLNRGSDKLMRLGMSFIVTAAATGDEIFNKLTGGIVGANHKFGRFFATTLIAIVEKFSGSHHDHSHDKKNIIERIQNDLRLFGNNIRDPKKWKELLPNLLNIETKVQILSPVANKLSNIFTKNLDGFSKTCVNLVAKILLTSLSFIGVDQVLKSIAKIYGNEGLVASISAICGCCASPVCTAAAADTALGDTF